LQQQVMPDIKRISLQLAERASIRGLLNSFFREIGVSELRLEGDLTGHSQSEEAGEAFVVRLPHSKMRLTGRLAYFSEIGMHQYAGPYYTSVQDEDYVRIDERSLIDLILEEISLYDEGDSRQRRLSELRAQVDNSLQNMRLFLSRSLARRVGQVSTGMDYVESEQSLLYGHPFHPTPKSAEGFKEHELPLYAPEHGASFQLHYYAIHPDYVKEEMLAGYAYAVPSSVSLPAESQLGEVFAHYRLLPLHPWQAQYVRSNPVVNRLLASQMLIDLGSLGPRVYPTSSVRTVWSPDEGMFYKLPLHVRITNFIRENTEEQLHRTMDAARILVRLGKLDESGAFQVMPEVGYRTVGRKEISSVPYCDGEDWTSIAASFAVVFRKAWQLDARESSQCFVVASLLECLPGETDAKLLQVIRQTCPVGIPDANSWLNAYLRISMLPLLNCLADNGISLEAHVQNSLVVIEHGWPVRMYARDLEGISVDAGIARREVWVGEIIGEDSPVLYTEAEAWFRLKYYFFVNHLGALIHTLASCSEVGEKELWSTVRRMLKEEAVVSAGDRFRACVHDLLHNERLPAKANLISRFQERGESPLYVDIPNPIYHCKEEL
jgi:siderophore synthetase component